MISAYKAKSVTQTLARGIMTLVKTSESPRTDAQLILAFCLLRDREWLIAHGETFISKAHSEKFEALCELRATGIPIAYILGSAWFCGREFSVNDKVLIPRPETERLVEDAIAHLRERINPSLPKALLTALDIGIGSGAIACTIAAEVPQVVVEGTEKSANALKVAEHNARRLNVFSRCKFMLGDLTSPLGARHYDAVIANLPYVPSGDIAQAPDPVSFEPRIALDGGIDGLDLYRRLLPALPAFLKPGALVLLEAAPPTMPGLQSLAQSAFAHSAMSVIRDYSGRDRYLRIVTPDSPVYFDVGE